MSTEESSADLTTPISPETATVEVWINNLSREDICNVISDINKIAETVHYDLKELKRKSIEKLQETDTFIENYQDLNQYVSKIVETATRRKNWWLI